MSTLITASLVDRLVDELATAEAIDIACAYCTASKPVERILAAGAIGKPIRALLGIDDSITSPGVIRRFCDLPRGTVRLGTARPPSTARFHPKVIAFHRPNGNGTAWIGSANLTDLAYSGDNEELVVQVPLTADILNWFEKLWSSARSRVADESAIQEYEQSRRFLPRPTPTATLRPPQETARIERNQLHASDHMSWDAYFARLCDVDVFRPSHDHTSWSVFGETFSYLETIREGQLLFGLSSWEILSDHAIRVLMPRSQSDEWDGAWGLLGSMGAAAKASANFRNDAEFRELMRKIAARAAASRSPEEFRSNAEVAVRRGCEIERVGPGVITRLLALACPQYAISVNSQSSYGLGMASLGKQVTATALGSPRSYHRLLEWAHRQPWFLARRPNGGVERLAWENRSALIDALVYDPRRSA